MIEERLQQLRAHVIAHPTQLDMNEWWCKKRDADFDVHPCETAGCFAGWLCQLSGEPWGYADNGPLPRYGQPALVLSVGAKRAADIAGLTVEQAVRLFLPNKWPAPFRARFDELEHDEMRLRYDSSYDEKLANIRCQKAAIAVERLDLFIASGGAE